MAGVLMTEVRTSAKWVVLKWIMPLCKQTGLRPLYAVELQESAIGTSELLDSVVC